MWVELEYIVKKEGKIFLTAPLFVDLPIAQLRIVHFSFFSSLIGIQRSFT